MSNRQPASLREALLWRRTELQHSQNRAAQLCGVSRLTFIRWERENAKPDARHRLGLARYLGMSIPEVTDLVEEPAA